jgi:hypothetical protein
MSDEIEKRLNEQRSSIKEINSKLMGLDAENNKDEFRTMSTKEEILTVLIVIVVVVFLYYFAK